MFMGKFLVYFVAIVIDMEKSVSLPPHIKIPTPQRGWEQGSNIGTFTTCQKLSHVWVNLYFYFVAIVIDMEKSVSLPPHIKIPTPEKDREPVTGSRKRKARKHSITHLLPAPTQSVVMNSEYLLPAPTQSIVMNSEYLLPAPTQSVVPNSEYLLLAPTQSIVMNSEYLLPALT